MQYKTHKTWLAVRRELRELGILEGLLEEVQLNVSRLPQWLVQARGWFFDVGVVGIVPRLLGWKEGVIYLAKQTEDSKDLRGVIRHEYAHAWAWSNPGYLRRPWFRKVFGRSYFGESWSLPRFRHFEATRWFHSHASAYATTSPAEDFAETFEIFVKHRNNLERFRSRPGLYKKLKAVERAVRQQKAELRCK